MTDGHHCRSADVGLRDQGCEDHPTKAGRRRTRKCALIVSIVIPLLPFMDPLQAAAKIQLDIPLEMSKACKLGAAAVRQDDLKRFNLACAEIFKRLNVIGLRESEAAYFVSYGRYQRSIDSPDHLKQVLQTAPSLQWEYGIRSEMSYTVRDIRKSYRINTEKNLSDVAMPNMGTLGFDVAVNRIFDWLSWMIGSDSDEPRQTFPRDVAASLRRWHNPIRIPSTGDRDDDQKIVQSLKEIKKLIPNAPIDSKTFPSSRESANFVIGSPSVGTREQLFARCMPLKICSPEQMARISRSTVVPPVGASFDTPVARGYPLERIFASTPFSHQSTAAYTFISRSGQIEGASCSLDMGTITDCILAGLGGYEMIYWKQLDGNSAEHYLIYTARIIYK